MNVRITIVRASNSPTQKVWGCIIPDGVSDAAIFYGPGTKLGGSVYRKPGHTAITMLNKKTRGEYSPLYDLDGELADGVSTKEAGEKLLRAIQTGNFEQLLRTIFTKSTHKPESPSKSPSITAERIQSAVRAIQSPDWAF
ncbi:hypothetical protein B1757_02885 [Acidithiobacillus marinus]|uniref:Uncharacterized protein n=1 Tax=Acidithiobacillus marinus TaxID=187490 RepID=A0A2I1DPF2_9PROT|nr:hypothetical protein [Acidithiobacillus marinus]PKY11753.1 hypothetical protein B1757_02885 [Acidithiobacillus marinus]